LLREEEILKGSTSICVSKFIAERMEALSLESKSNLIHIPNGIDAKIFHPMKRSIDRDLLYFGRFQKVKGLDMLIAALNLLEKHGESPLLGIVGSFSQKERAFVLSLASDGVKKHIEFLGHIQHESVPNVLNSSKILVVPSRYESFSLPSLEAMACGNPIIASRVGGIPELIDDVGGVLVEPGDANALAQGISLSLKDDSLVDKALLLGPRKAARYDWEVVAPMLGKLV
ncbi:MAG TPA: glycosyltransferase family 4 protein, partial [Nitrososphaerales archaeon]|nr:glycosyltransferase family 4 protein [Nitrososphaerales archaeon]